LLDKTLSFAANTLFNTFREIEQNGKTWLVVNGVPLVEGVLNGRLVPMDEFGAFVQDWNDVRVVLRHPKQNGGSARVPNADSPTIGRFYNSKIDPAGKRLVGEFWLDKNALEEMPEGNTLLDLIRNNKPIEVSTGYWSESIPETGRFNGKDYGLIDRKIHPDHIALLPDEVGACSISDGCGLNRNSAMCQNCEKSHAVQITKNSIEGSYERRLADISTAFHEMMRLRDARASELGSETAPVAEYWIEATTDQYIICQKGTEMYRVGYTYNEDNGKVYFDDESEWVPIIKVESYVEKLTQNVTGSLPAEGKKIYEAVYKEYKDKKLSDAEAAQRAWGAVKNAGWYQDKDKVWHKKAKSNQEDGDILQLFALYSIYDFERSKV